MTAQPELNGLASRDSVELDEPPHSLIFDMGRVTIIDDVGLLEYTPELAAAFHPLRYMIHVPTMHEYAQTARVDNFVPPIFGRALLKGLERISSHMLDQIEKSPS